MDALEVIKAIKGEVDWSISSFVQDIMNLSKSFASFEFSWKTLIGQPSAHEI